MNKLNLIVITLCLTMVSCTKKQEAKVQPVKKSVVQQNKQQEIAQNPYEGYDCKALQKELVLIEKSSINSINDRIIQLKKLCFIAEQMDPNCIWENSNTNVVYIICNDLKALLKCQDVVKTNLNSLLKEITYISYVHSDDNRLWVFSIPDNTGGTWQSNSTVIGYRTKDNKPKCDVFITDADDANDENKTTGFNPEGANYSNKIFKLKSNKNLYLLIGSGTGDASTNFYEANVIQLTDNGINYDVKVFPSTENKEEYVNSYNLSTTDDEGTKFNYNDKNQEFDYVYKTDEGTPYTPDDAKKVTGKLTFNGTKFIEKIKLTK